MNFINTAIAQETVNAAAKPPSVWASLMPLVLIMVVFYFLLIRPQQKKLKEHQLLIKAISKGDEVVTSGGIYGTVVKVEETNNIVHVEIADKITIKVKQDMIIEVNRDVKDVKEVKEIKDTKRK